MFIIVVYICFAQGLTHRCGLLMYSFICWNLRRTAALQDWMPLKYDMGMFLTGLVMIWLPFIHDITDHLLVEVTSAHTVWINVNAGMTLPLQPGRHMAWHGRWHRSETAGNRRMKEVGTSTSTAESEIETWDGCCVHELALQWRAVFVCLKR